MSDGSRADRLWLIPRRRMVGVPGSVIPVDIRYLIGDYFQICPDVSAIPDL